MLLGVNLVINSNLSGTIQGKSNPASVYFNWLEFLTAPTMWYLKELQKEKPLSHSFSCDIQ